MDRENVITLYNGILLSLNKERNPSISDDMNKHERNCTSWNHPAREREILMVSVICGMKKNWKVSLMKIESRMVFASSWRARTWGETGISIHASSKKILNWTEENNSVKMTL